MAFTFKEVAEILKIIDASQCEEVVIELQGLRLVVRRGNPHGTWAPAGESSLREAPTRLAANAQAVTAPASRGAKGFRHPEVELTVAEGSVAVRAPTVGSFYRRPSPEESPFAEIGQRVKKGDPLCLIEVMKLYTTIPSPADGVLEAIAAEDRAPVEFDQLLFVIKPDA